MNILDDDHTFALLGAIHHGMLSLEGENLVVTVPTGKREVFPQRCLDVAEANGWLTIDEAGPRLTPQGKYWMRRWADRAAAKFKREQLRRMKSCKV